MKFRRLMFVFSGVHLRTRRDSFFLSIHQTNGRKADLRRRSRIWQARTSRINGIDWKYVAGKWIEVNVYLWVLNAHDFLILKDLV